jgi:cyanoexosortase B-associated protein
MISQPTQRSPLIPILVVLFILAIALTSAIPNYFSGNWVWRREAKLERVAQLKAIQKAGLALPGWKTLEQDTVELGGHKWSIQAIVPEAQAKTATVDDATILMLRPQTWQRDMPQVDWVDINGAQRWTADSLETISLALPDRSTTIRARFLRGWHEKRTYAALQWYAWEKGGSPAPASWFWADQASQLRDRHRSAWVAVSILIPIQPLGDIAPVRPEAEALGQLVQTTLMAKAL